MSDNPFDKLLDDLGALAADQETMAKSYTPADDAADDKNIADAADDKGDGDLDDDGTNDESGEKVEGEGEGDEKPMGKSFELELENGEKVEAFDATELLKSMMGRQDAQETALTKALEITLGTVKTQGDMIKSLQDQVTKLSNAGRGRKTAVTMHEKPAPTMAKSHEVEGVSPNEFMAKALVLQEQGKLSGLDVSRAEAYINRGEEIPMDIRTKVLAQ